MSHITFKFQKVSNYQLDMKYKWVGFYPHMGNLLRVTDGQVLSGWDVSPYPTLLSCGELPELMCLECKIVVSHIIVASTQWTYLSTPGNELIVLSDVP